MRATYQREVDELEAHRLPRLGGVGVALRRSARHRVGDHELLPRPLQRRRRHPRAGRRACIALVATAIGLFAAIPAVVAYNRFAHDIDRLGIRFESFMEEFSNILQRNLR